MWLLNILLVSSVTKWKLDLGLNSIVSSQNKFHECIDIIIKNFTNNIKKDN